MEIVRLRSPTECVSNELTFWWLVSVFVTRSRFHTFFAYIRVGLVCWRWFNAMAKPYAKLIQHGWCEKMRLPNRGLTLWKSYHVIADYHYE